MVWWEAVLSPALQVLFDKLTSGDIGEFLNRWNMDEFLLEKLKIAYFTNTAVLEDAEEKQYNNPAVETWLDMLKDVVYDAEDILDELATEALRCRSQVRNWNFIPTSFNPFVEAIESKIEKVIDKLEYISKQKDALGLMEKGGGRLGIAQRAPSTPIAMESHVYGRESDKEEIIKRLLADEDVRNSVFGVLPILGMGGLGKTALVQIVYSDKRIDDFFHMKAWACVSDEFSILRVTKTLLESATKMQCDTMNLELLQDGLKRKLSNKKFLIVLDDVWNENYDNWIDLQIPFMVGAEGSKIIVTTRNEEVLSVMNALPPYRLKELSDDSCRVLFEHHAFGNKSPNAYPYLKTIGQQILIKCKGLPLAAKVLGGLLGSKLNTRYWNYILNSNIWDLPPKRSNILPVLRLSYNHLPANLKRCFAYCSVFPKGYEFDKGKLVLLWMAEGFLQNVDESESMEEVGDEYFSELVARSFFQKSSQDETRYLTHDLIHDLAQSVSRKMFIRMEDKFEHGKPIKVFEKTRHFSYICNKYDVFKKFEWLYNVKWLRTFFPLPSSNEGGFSYLSNKVPRNLLPTLRCLRVLALNGYCIDELPDSIGNLIHLRYFDLSQTAMKILPESTSTLYNLQTLLLYDCDSLTTLPANTGNLISLRHLGIRNTGLQEMPLRLGNLTSLQTLPEFIVGDDSGSRIGELRNLSSLKGTLSILKLENVTNTWDAREANLMNKKSLDELVMEWGSDFENNRNESIETDVLDMLEPHRMLKKITIKYYGGKRFPNWITDPSFSNMVFLSISGCRNCTSLPSFGQLPSLKELYIKGITKVKNIGIEFYGNGFTQNKPFPLLEILSFEDMVEWEEWSHYHVEEEIEASITLHQLYVKACPKLRGKLPSQLPTLKKLVIHDCQQLTSSLPKLSSLHKLHLKGCPEVLVRGKLDLSSLVSLHITDISRLNHLPKELVQCLSRLEHLRIIDCPDFKFLWQNEVGLHHLASLHRLVIRNCPQLISLLHEDQQLPNKIKYLELDYCHSLEKLPYALQNLTSLEELAINQCPRLVLIPKIVMPSMLRALSIRVCSLESLPKELTHNRITPLEYLYISGCYDFTSFPRGGELLPTTFKQLTVDHCLSLESLPEGMLHSHNISLKVLEIFDCSSLASFPMGELPYKLTTLTIWNCPNIESLQEIAVQGSTMLETFRIGKCTNLKHLPNGLNKLSLLDYFEIEGSAAILSFPEGGFPTNSLQKVYIVNCESLKSLPDQMLKNTSLQELHISDCPSIESFPEGGLPITLVSLEINNCEKLMPLSEWGLHRLTSLRKLQIIGGCLDFTTFPEWLLPSTLTYLQIGRLPNLESLSKWLTNLTSLEELTIRECHKLTALPDEGLPASLSRLEISDCPLLEQRCEKDWEKIDHIPCIVM